MDENFKKLFFGDINIAKKSCSKIWNSQKRIGLDHHITSHGLRQTHTSLLLYKRVNIMTISKRIGHSNISIILDMYFHILKELKKFKNIKVKNIFSKINKDIKFATTKKKERNR